MNQLINTQIVIELCMAFFCFICGLFTFYSRKKEPERSHCILILLTLGELMMLCDATAWYYRGVPGAYTRLVLQITNSLVFALYPLMFIFVSHYLHQLITLHGGHIKVYWRAFLDFFCTLDILLLVYSQFTGFFFYLDGNNIYHRGNGYIMTTIISGALLFSLIAMTVVYRQVLTFIEGLAITLFCVMPLGTAIFQTLHYGLSLNEITSALCMLLFFLFHEHEKSDWLLKQEILLDAQQMQPHFLFNALGSIEQLCRSNPERAAEATHVFARYLRNNLLAMGSCELRSFHEELSNIRAYVWLEKMRFGEDLSFEEELETMDFKVPILSVQPLVENAVKHGMADWKTDVLHVTLKTWEEEEAYLIQVVDDGCGFIPENLPQDDRIHIGFNNARKRISYMCNGQIEIKSTLGQGSCFTIRIPRTGSIKK